MHPAVITYLRCPVCRDPLHAAERSLRCPRGHSFDVARQGYVDLTAGRVTHPGDSAEMVQARVDLLSGGHYDLISDALAASLPGAGFVVEVGAGTAHHLARALPPDAFGLAVDVSKAALRRAARADPRIGAVRADVWHGLPLADGAADAVLDVFAPRSPEEFARVLRPGGRLVVVTPAPEHLGELVAALGLLGVGPDKPARLAAGLGEVFDLEERRRLTAPLRLRHAEAQALVAMGPSAWHTDPAAVEAALRGMPEPIAVTAAVELTVWRRR
ncbi:putative RNA methyltransferase [Dactylosporangium sp. NPDC005572]|uniref:putative RNA methyltransferase n=1 Tax=Dactylosporangium sp. NPDC005572 TaxID=3156889 RepID=UPI0033B17F9F